MSILGSFYQGGKNIPIYTHSLVVSRNLTVFVNYVREVRWRGTGNKPRSLNPTRNQIIFLFGPPTWSIEGRLLPSSVARTTSLRTNLCGNPVGWEWLCIVENRRGDLFSFVSLWRLLELDWFDKPQWSKDIVGSKNGRTVTCRTETPPNLSFRQEWRKPTLEPFWANKPVSRKGRWPPNDKTRGRTCLRSSSSSCGNKSPSS